MLKAREDTTKLALKQIHGDLMSARFTRELIDVDKHGVNYRPILYRNDVLNVLWRHELVARD